MTGKADLYEPLASSRIRVEIDAASFRTGNGARDVSVRSARFLDAGRHPVMVFVAEKMEGDAPDGALTVCGTTRPVRLPAGVRRA
jgi:polyisoprenoid-binding protein YceI